MDPFLAPFLLGIGAAANPCLLPLSPGFIAHLAGNGAAAGRGTAILGSGHHVSSVARTRHEVSRSALSRTIASPRRTISRTRSSTSR